MNQVVNISMSQISYELHATGYEPLVCTSLLAARSLKLIDNNSENQKIQLANKRG
jgi:hypothetical protein